MTASDAQPILEAVRKSERYKELRFFRVRNHATSPAHVGYATKEVRGLAALCGVRSIRRPIAVSGTERLCQGCQQQLETLKKIHVDE